MMIPQIKTIYLPKLDLWEVVEDWFYTTNSGITICIKKGFRYNGASVPRPGQVFITKYELSMEGPAPHDKGYETGGVFDVYENGKVVDQIKMTRHEVDLLFYEIMCKMEIEIWKRVIAYRAVRDFGQSHWKGEPDPAEKSDPGPACGKLFQ
jgi:hypothetical protein